MKRHILFVLLLVILSYWSIRPIVGAGFFPMHDDTQVTRVIVMGRALRNGQFPVRWVSDLGYGYGYPIFNFYGPLPYYVGGFLYALGVDSLVATKSMFVLGIVLAGLGMYALGNALFGRIGGLLSAVLYMYAPYHAVQIYVRGSVGEFWTLVFLPLIGLGLWRIYRRPADGAGILIGGSALAGVILSHTIVGYFTSLGLGTGILAFAVMSSALRRFNAVKFRSYGLLLLVGFGISAFFWLPAILEMRATDVAGQVSPTADFHNHFVCVSQLWNSPWGFGGSAPGCIDGMSFKLGKLHILVSLGALLFVLLRRKIPSSARFVLMAFLGMTIVSVFLMMPGSVWLWENIPYFAFIQYPWRFLTYSVLGLSVLGAGITLFSNKTAVRVLATGTIIVGVLLLYTKLFVPQYTYTIESREFERAADIRYRVSKISDEYLPPGLPRPQSVSEVIRDTIQAPENVRVETEIDTETYIKSFVDTQKESSVRIMRAYFPGWHYWVNGREVYPTVTQGIPTIAVPISRSAVEARFTDTPIRTYANLISLVTFGAILLIYGKKTIT